jgi:hypothetical protein
MACCMVNYPKIVRLSIEEVLAPHLTLYKSVSRRDTGKPIFASLADMLRGWN